MERGPTSSDFFVLELNPSLCVTLARIPTRLFSGTSVGLVLFHEVDLQSEHPAPHQRNANTKHEKPAGFARVVAPQRPHIIRRTDTAETVVNCTWYTFAVHIITSMQSSMILVVQTRQYYSFHRLQCATFPKFEEFGLGSKSTPPNCWETKCNSSCCHTHGEKPRCAQSCL